MRSDRKLNPTVWLFWLFLGLGCLGLAGSNAWGEQDSGPQAKDYEQQPPDYRVTLTEAEVLRVSLEQARVHPDQTGADRSWNEAFMVRLGMTLSPAMGPTFDIYLGDERVPEYGGWEGGIYFWVYDPKKLESLEGRTVSYRFDRSEPQEIGVLLLGDPERFRQVPEAELRDR